MGCNITLLVMSHHHHWHWHHIMTVASSIETLHSLSQDDRNAIKHDFFGHAMPLTLAAASCDANHIVNVTNELQHDFWPCDTIGIGSVVLMVLSIAPLDFFDQEIKMRCKMIFGSCDAIGISITWYIAYGMWCWCQQQYLHWHKNPYITPKNHFYIKDTMVPLMASSAPCHIKHVTAM